MDADRQTEKSANIKIDIINIHALTPKPSLANFWATEGNTFVILHRP